MTYPKAEDLKKPISLPTPPPPEDITKAFSTMILSASGWRKVFAADGNEHSSSPGLSPPDIVILSTAARVFSSFMRHHNPNASTLLVSADTRPTGCEAAQVIIRTLLHEQWEVRFPGSAPIPEVIAYNMMNHDIHGGVYISASHNPMGHNGLKFFCSAGVIGGSDSSQLISMMKKEITHSSAGPYTAGALGDATYRDFCSLISSMEQEKLFSEDAYRQFTGLTASASTCLCSQDSLYSRIRESVQTVPLTIVIDYNGSARTRTIDKDLLGSLGIKCITINDATGNIVHGIIPEGENLQPLKSALEDAYRHDPSCIIGFMCDNDGDRGNIVYIDENTGRAHIMEAQEVFSLVFAAESAYMHYLGTAGEEKLAAAVNCATSMRIDDIARCFNIEVYRSEVGEANVVGLAEALRNQGYTVRVLGEGSNGGNITHPSVVRDPLNTLFSIIKLLTIRDTPSNHGLFHIWHSRSGAEEPYYDCFSLKEVMESLPAYCTTNASEQRALLHVPCSDQEAFKQQYERLFRQAFEKDSAMLEAAYGITSWREFNTEGITSREGMGPGFRSGASSGGLRIVFYDRNEQPLAFIWMRKSGTEPVFRILADVKGKNPRFEEELLAWHSVIIEKAVEETEKTR